ncbi:hypothetical protein V4U86_01805 [Mycobacterium sp. AMU20-3851]|uniref:hypothetical protein n=1 Tax=Mycobacterium sp. AMU20-3851 TaxID=3122055 RepID=UPI0037552B63
MSMQLSMKPYVTVGVALVGASVIAVAPIAPRAELHMPAVNLTASIDNPITVFKPVVNAAGDLIRETLQAEFADPFPILRQIFANQRFTVEKLLEAINGGGAALGELVAGLPAALSAAGAILRTGDVNGAIDSLVASGLNPILNFITGVTVPLQAALQRPFAVGEALVGAAFESGLALTVALAQTFIGIGFPVGTTPVLQNLVTVTETLLKSIGTLNPINIINAVQNGVADVLMNAVTHLSDFMTQSVPYIRGVIVNALKAGQPAGLNRTADVTAAVATVPTAAAQTVTISLPGAEADGGASEVAPVSNTDTPVQAPAAEAPAAEAPAAEAPAEVPAEEADVLAEPVEEAEIEEPETAEPAAPRPSLKKAASGKSSPKRAGNPRAAA